MHDTNDTNAPEESIYTPFDPKSDLSDFIEGTEPADPADATCQVPECDAETVNGALCDDHCPPRVQPARLCRMCGAFTVETFVAGTPDGATYPVCSSNCLAHLAEGWR